MQSECLVEKSLDVIKIVHNRIMRVAERKWMGFTLMELMIVLVVIGIAAAVAVTSVSNQIAESRLKGAADELASVVSQACSKSIQGGCPIRLLHCANPNCANVATQALAAQSSTAGNFIGNGSGAARFLATIRQTTPCAGAAGVLTDGWANWDMDRKPKEISQELAFASIYSGGGVISSVNADGPVGATLTAADVTNSIWFDPNGTMQIPVGNNQAADGSRILLQLNMAACNPAADSNCLGMFVTISPGCRSAVRPCLQGARANNSDTCFSP